MLDLLVRGGRVVTPQGVGLWDIGIQGEQIALIGAAGTLPAAARTLEASGKIVVPGGTASIPTRTWPTAS
jgi:dihydroorotase-like cyclic amidohydrolase